MDHQTDTGCMLPGKGDASPLPQRVAECSMEQRLEEKDRYISLLEKQVQWLMEDNAQWRDLAKSQQKRIDELMLGKSEPPRATSVTFVRLPQMFSASVKQDEHRASILVSLIRQVIAPATCQRKQKPYIWRHVRMVLAYHGLIDRETKIIDFSRDMAELLLGERDTKAWELKADSVRHYASKEHREEPDYTMLPNGNNTKESCIRVEKVLASVL